MLGLEAGPVHTRVQPLVERGIVLPERDDALRHAQRIGHQRLVEAIDDRQVPSAAADAPSPDGASARIATSATRASATSVRTADIAATAENPPARCGLRHQGKRSAHAPGRSCTTSARNLSRAARIRHCAVVSPMSSVLAISRAVQPSTAAIMKAVR